MEIDNYVKYQYILFKSIEMWYENLITLSNHNHKGLHTNEYSTFISNVLNMDKHKIMSAVRVEMKQAIDDFYDYFYTKQHICDVNNDWKQLDNDYGIGSNKLRLYDTVQNMEYKNLKASFKNITNYVFEMCINMRNTLGLKAFTDKEKDRIVVKYFIHYPSIEADRILQSEKNENFILG
jgi:hypothetical protein